MLRKRRKNRRLFRSRDLVSSSKNIMSEKLESALVGVAGEYFVAGELSRRGYIASITLRNSKGIDIIASNPDGTRSISIQVKTNSSGEKSWILNKKSEEYFSENHYYIFVALGELNQRPVYHIVPSKDVADYITSDHSNWLKLNKRDGTQRKDTPMRKFNDIENQYHEAWYLINL